MVVAFPDNRGDLVSVIGLWLESLCHSAEAPLISPSCMSPVCGGP